MRRVGPLLVAAVLLAGCGGAPAKDLPPEWKGRDVEANGWANTMIQGNWSFGLEYAFPKGKEVHWDWVAETDGYLYFRLFLQLNGQAIAVGGQHNNEGRSSYTTAQAGTYFFVWDLDGLPTTLLHYKLPEGGIEHDWPPGSGPGCPPLLLC